MCMSPKIPDPVKQIIPESVKRVGKDQRRATDNNNQAAATAAGATTTGAGAAAPAALGKKSLLGA